MVLSLTSPQPSFLSSILRLGFELTGGGMLLFSLRIHCRPWFGCSSSCGGTGSIPYELSSSSHSVSASSTSLCLTDHDMGVGQGGPEKETFLSSTVG